MDFVNKKNKITGKFEKVEILSEKQESLLKLKEETTQKIY
jgi:hypothetical protein